MFEYFLIAYTIGLVIGAVDRFRRGYEGTGEIDW